MNLNEVFDDDIPDDDDIVAEPEAARIVEDPEIVEERPVGQFSRVIAGRTIWFKPAVAGQFAAFRRYREVLARRYEVLAVKARKSPSVEMLNQIAELAEKIDLTTLEFAESLLADPNDADFIAMEMIGGRVTMIDIQNVLFRDPEPDDDQDPVQKTKPVRKQTASKKAANAKRTQRK